MKETINYYEVITKCGHVGRKSYVPIKFALVAENGREAARIAREFPRVKHNHKDAILKVTKIDYERYLEIKEMNNNDPYLKCHSKKEQKQIENFEERIVDDPSYRVKKYDRFERMQRVAFKLRKYKLLEQH